ncbi:hypothetical protein NQ314_015324 [Rhamnusium bicolor]|uniref:Uncharacterized protein n=1 Tax=Rhamnusium bicolor TaxID=1586634 RepID=A0AAV8WZ36_9CUCU|nr:hypothetical protein NQ314_015324 [Rhamnusium bicolor]
MIEFFSDVNECENPEIKLACKFGCVNFIGSYHCAKHSNETLSDQPAEAGKISTEDEQDYEEGDYEDEDYENYDDNEDYNENEAVKKEENVLKEEKESIIENNEDMVMNSSDKNKADTTTSGREADKEFDKDYGGKTETTADTASPQGLTTTTVEPEVIRTSDEKTVDNKDNEIDEYDDDYNEGDYDDEYDEENNEENVEDKTSLTKENEVVNRIDETTAQTIIESNRNEIVNKENEIIKDELSFEKSDRNEKETVNIVPTISSFDNSGKVTSKTPTEITEIPSDNKHFENTTHNEEDYEEGDYDDNGNESNTKNSSNHEMPKKEIENKQDENYDEDYEGENDTASHKKETEKENNLLPTETSFVTNRIEITSEISKINLNKENDDTDHDNYDEDYEDEYYDEDIDKKTYR